MEELEEGHTSSTSSKMDQQDDGPDADEESEGVVTITLPEQLLKITPAEDFIGVRHRWNSNEEIASILIAFERHKEWLILPQKIRPASGSMLLYNRKVVFYKRDGYCWKKRRNGSTIREDHMKLKVNGLECIYGSYVHSAVLPTFHRRCYWLLQNPNIVLLHYLNVPYPDAFKPSIFSLSSELKRREWSKEELVDQLRPMLSRVSHSTEHETDEEQKVEKALDELLPILMPMHEGNNGLHISSGSQHNPPTSVTLPIAPRQTTQVQTLQLQTALSSSSVTPSSSTPCASTSQEVLKRQLATHKSQNMQPATRGQVLHLQKQLQQRSIPTQSKIQNLPQSLIYTFSGQNIATQAQTTNQFHCIQSSTTSNLAQASTDTTSPTSINRNLTSNNCFTQVVSNSAKNVTLSKNLIKQSDGLVYACQSSQLHLQQQAGNQQQAKHVDHFLSFPEHLSESSVTNSSGQGLNQEHLTLADSFLQTDSDHVKDERMTQGGVSNQMSQGPAKDESKNGPHQHNQQQINSCHQRASMSSSSVKLESSMDFISESQSRILHQVQNQDIQGANGLSQFQQPLAFPQQKQQQGLNQKHLTLTDSLLQLDSDHVDKDQMAPGVMSNQMSQGPGKDESKNGPKQCNQQQINNSHHRTSLSSLPAKFESSMDFIPESQVHNPDMRGVGILSHFQQPFTFPQQQQQQHQQQHQGPQQPSVAALQLAQQNNHSLELNASAQQCQTCLQGDAIVSFPHQTQHEPQQQHAHHPQSAPVLTLHLKSGDGSSDSPGIVLSLQGATIMSQQTHPSLFSSGEQQTNAKSCNIAQPPGLFLMASHDQSGQLIVNRISNSPNIPKISQGANPGLAFVSSSSQTMGTILNEQPINSCPGISSCSYPVYPHSTVTTTSSFAQSLQSQPSPFLNATTSMSSIGPQFSQSSPHMNTCPLQMQANIETSQQLSFPTHLSTYAKNINPSPGGQAPFDCIVSQSGGKPSAFGNVIHGKDPGNAGFHSEVAKDASGMDTTVFGLQPGVQQGTNTTSHQTQAADLLAGTSGMSAVKDMINNPDSCDTLDGSFSSLPSADLNFDDILDLHDLNDVCGLTISPLHDEEVPSPVLQTKDLAASAADLNSRSTNVCCDSLQTAMSCKDGGGTMMNAISCSSSHAKNNAPSTPESLLCFNPSGDAVTSTPTKSCEDDSKEEIDTEVNAVIRDFSPDWAYTKGNTKVLVAGPWSKEGACYTCVFDGDHIPAQLIQHGLLRCFTPYHSPGFATLQVACDGRVISNCEVFQFCERESNNSQNNPDWFALQNNQLKLLLVERLDQLQRKFTFLDISFQDNLTEGMDTMDATLVEQMEKLVKAPWSNTDVYPKAGQHHLTVLHLAAALGLAKFIACLIRWRLDKSSVTLDFEVDALSVDSHACTPLMWACAMGHIDAALTLYRWNALPLKMCNKDGLLPLTVARNRGHFNLACQIDQLERAQDQERKAKKECKADRKLEASTSAMDVTSPPSSICQMLDSPSGPLDVNQTKNVDCAKNEAEVFTETTSSFPKPMKPGPKLIRRFSEQVIGHASRPLNKRNSVDLMPSGQDIDQATLPTITSSLDQPIRDACSEPQLSVSPDMVFVAPPAPRLLLEDKINEPTCVHNAEPPATRMDTDEISSVQNSSPLIDVEHISSDEESEQKEDTKHQMVTLANQIIAAIPERIKLSPSKGDDVDDASSGRGRSESHGSLPSQGSPRPSSFGDDSGISTPMTDSLAFEEYRYPEFGTPSSSLSPDSTCLPSPYSPYNFTLDSPPPTTAEFTEYFNAPTTYMEKDFSQLTLSDQEQRKLYEAAKVIQNAYRHYRDKQHQQQLQQQKEIEAAVLIQSYYRRYKTYAYYKKMSHAAVLIQNQFRTYYAKRKKRGDGSVAIQGIRRESERLKKGRNQSVIIQQRFRSHYQRKSLDGKDGPGPSQSSDVPDRELYQIIQVVRFPSGARNKLSAPR